MPYLPIHRIASWCGVIHQSFRRWTVLWGLGLSIFLAPCSRSASGEDTDRVLYNRDIRPILSDACFQCHGPDEGQRQGGLRLDLSEAAMRGGDSGPAIVTGN